MRLFCETPTLSRRTPARRERRALRLSLYSVLRQGRRCARSASRRDDPARRARRAFGVGADRRSRLCRAAWRTGAAIGRRPSRARARFFLRAQSGDAEFRQALWRQTGDRRACLRDQLSRTFAFRRAGRARKRHAGPRPGAERLAQSRHRRFAEGRARRPRRRPRGRNHAAAGVARRGAVARLGAVRPSRADRRSDRPADGSLYAPRSDPRRRRCRPASTPIIWRPNRAWTR